MWCKKGECYVYWYVRYDFDVPTLLMLDHCDSLMYQRDGLDQLFGVSGGRENA